jgi:hypothetical protein
MVLAAAPLPGLPAASGAAGDTDRSNATGPVPTKKSTLLALYREHAEYGNRDVAARVAAELAPQAGLQPGTARAYLYAELESRAS